MNFLRSGRSQSLYLSIRRAIKQILLIIEAYQFVKYVQNFIQLTAVKAAPYAEEIIGNHQCGCERNRSTTLKCAIPVVCIYKLIGGYVVKNRTIYV